MLNKLIIVAHPDDETIFAGNFIRHTNGCKVVCVTNGSNPVRSREFQTVMKKLGVEEYEIWDYADVWNGDFDREKLKEDISRVLLEHDFKMVITHNPEGEYGHTQHAALSETVSELRSENLFFFTKGKKLSFWKRLNKWMILFKYKSERRVVLSKEVREYIICEKMKEKAIFSR